ncbi:hypothetical protein LEP1GSC050_2890 [Leptospira broomii serovar Hurstbridge str. 5399]|uniref:Uncharacterized protein n=1 Tax=Leptospira broomii serovar Hurstbridge str. 5399 TaxID=1049789 RepID=T0GFR0_9LEPT|nr:hypothetical protein LEP1GSC050_2890 [Leptospira broomii serovar Hurstbridge str. 5399]
MGQVSSGTKEGNTVTKTSCQSWFYFDEKKFPIVSGAF